ncbi:unnamed protein product [Colias eurytheme]|nr:unnamed protein product [Colias eurytheme]
MKKSSQTVAWFNSYLSGKRCQTVAVNKEDGSVSFSECTAVTRGVPQGSILGPLLFILYSADIFSCIHHCQYHAYADDIQLYISFDPSQTLASTTKLNSDLDRISAWSRENSLVLNKEKTKYMILGTPNMVRRIECENPIVTVENSSIERVNEARNLGVVFDENLRFEKHVNTTIANCFYRLKLLYRIREHLNVEVRIRLCESLVLSKFNYADVMYGPRLLRRSKNAIQRVQNACARFCWDVPPRSHITPYLMEAGCLKMESRRRLHLASLLFGVVMTKAPKYLYDKLAWMGEGSVYATRSSFCKLAIPRSVTAAFRGSFKYSATKCWNNLPPPILNSISLNSFKQKYKKYLLHEFKFQP